MKSLPEKITYASRQVLGSTIQKLRHLDYDAVDVDTIKDMLKPLFSGHYVVCAPIIPKGHRFYRGVRRPEKPGKVSELSYPPTAEITCYQRANRPGEPLFYCCTSRNVPFFELGLMPGECVAVSRWRSDERIILNNVGYMHEVFASKDANRQCPRWGGKREHPSYATQENQLITRFLSEEFTKVVLAGEEVRHKTSVAIAEKHFRQDITMPDGKRLAFSALLYPTIAMKANADNLAVKPEFVDLHFRLEQVEYIRVDDAQTAEYEYKVTILDFANTFGADGAIEWRGRRPQWRLKHKGEQLLLTVEDGQWVARNPAGEIVEPD